MRIRTARCILRPVRLADADILHSAMLHSNFSKGLRRKRALTTVDAIRRHTKKHARKDSYFCSIVLAKSKRCIGRIGISKRRGDSWHLAYWLHPDEQQRGYMRECIDGYLRRIFRTTDIEAIFADCHVWNAASRRLLERHMKKIRTTKTHLYFKSERTTTLRSAARLSVDSAQ